MYKQSGLLVIAALVIASMGMLAPTTTVSASAPTVTLTPSGVRDNAYVQFTITVTNPSDSENIENILIKDVTTDVSSYFSNGIFGADNLLDNIENIGENLIQAGNELSRVSDNFEEALVDLKAAGQAFIDAADFLGDAADNMVSSAQENINEAGSDLLDAKDYLNTIGTALRTEPIRFMGIRDNMKLAGYYVGRAGDYLRKALAAPAGNANLVVGYAGENLDNAGTLLENWISDNFAKTMLHIVAENENGLWTVAQAVENAGDSLENYTGTGSTFVNKAGRMLDNVASKLKQVVENLKKAAENIVEAGLSLDAIIDNFLVNAENLPLTTRDCGVGDETPYLAESFVENLENAAWGLSGTCPDNSDDQDNLRENLLTAGDIICSENGAAGAQNIWLGTTLGSNFIGYGSETNTARYWIGIAGASLKDNDNIGLTAAASAFDNAGAKLKAAGEAVKDLKDNSMISPTTGWGAEVVSKGLVLTALKENRLLPGASKTFKFLWMAPDISVAKDYTISVWTHATDNDVLSQTSFTVSIDGKPASIDIKVQQTDVKDYQGTAVENLVGQVYDNKKVTITITASEALTGLGSIRIENYKKAGENLVLAYSDFTASADKKTFTYDFYTTDWHENAANRRQTVTDNTGNPRVRIAGPSSTDNTGIENENEAVYYFTVDTLAPIQVDNGLGQFQDLAAMQKPGTDNIYYVSTVKSWTIKGRAEDNDNMGEEGAADNALWAITTVYVNDVAKTMIRLVDDNFSAGSENLDEGVNKIRVYTKDRVGLSLENKLENIYIDNTVPTVAAVTIAGKTWTENGLKISDNKPTFRLKIKDSGWGVPWADNCLQVYLDNDTNKQNGYIDNLENYGVWDNGACTGDYNFENTYDNGGKGLAGGTWYIRVEVSDNLPHWEPGTRDNDNWVQSFVIDVTAPTAPASVSGSVSAGASAATKEVITTTSIVITGTAEADSTIIVEVSTDNGVTWTEDTTAGTTVDSSGNWSTTVSVTQGTITGIRFSAKDSAGNTGTTTLFGYVLADSSSPTVSITAPKADATTDAATIAVTGTIGKDAWEAYGDLTLTLQIGTGSVSVPISSDGSFTYSVALSEGTNTIVASVNDGVNQPATASVTVTRTVTPWATYAIIVVIVALILAAIAIFRKR